MRLAATTVLLLATGCVTSTIPAGTYEIYRSDQPKEHTLPYTELVITTGALELSTFHPETANFADGLASEIEPTACVVERFLEEDGEFTTSLYFATPEQVGRRWEIRLLETHHFWSWLQLELREGSLIGTVEQRGWGGTHSASLRIARVAGPEPNRCVRGALEAIPAELH